ncbi:hypothetical protein [Bacillus smithii]|uniref:hypothetical protein n=1 Tax=Bacillus smithii TaxID=1479 RepID=UPI002E1FB2E3|nr:hypothetical protein [Bacillus smithii]MED4928975.1 hypothetical protein [Bacillus smithii]
MNIVEMYDLCKKIYLENVRTPENWENGFEYIGLRFENKEREIGEICNNSKHNPNREDEREFPEYGTDKYFEMEELDGTSAWDMSQKEVYAVGCLENRKDDCRNHFITDHCYIIASNELGKHPEPDYNEIVIKNAIVIAKIF